MVNRAIYWGLGSSLNAWNEAVTIYSIKHKGQSEEIASKMHLLGTGDTKIFLSNTN